MPHSTKQCVRKCIMSQTCCTLRFCHILCCSGEMFMCLSELDMDYNFLLTDVIGQSHPLTCLVYINRGTSNQLRGGHKHSLWFIRNNLTVLFRWLCGGLLHNNLFRKVQLCHVSGGNFPNTRRNELMGVNHMSLKMTNYR